MLHEEFKAVPVVYSNTMQYSERLMVGIAGPSCSGKSTLERNLEVALGDEISVLPFDDMTLELDDPAEIGADSWEHPECYRWEDYRRHLIELKLGQTTVVHVNRWETEITGKHERPIEARSVVVSVGFLALYDEIARGLFDLKLYLDIPEDEVIKRRSEVERMLHPAIDPMPYIMDHILPASREYVIPQREHADFVIDGLQPKRQVLQRSLMTIRTHQVIK
jgi:uridine kinase